MTGKSIKLIGFTAAISALLVVPSLVFAVFNHYQSVTSDCSDNKVVVKLHFTNNEPNDSLNVTVKDNVSDQTIDMGSIGAGKSQDGEIATNQQSIQNGSVRYTITKDGTDDNDIADLGYAATCGEGPTATPTLTPTGTPTTLIVKKHVINDNFGTESAKDFTIFIKDVNADKILSQSFGSEAGMSFPVDSGILYTVYEGSHDGYDQTFLGDCSGMIPQGETKTCTLINDDKEGFFPSPTPTSTPTATATPTPTDSDGNNNCDNTNQSGTNDNNNCNQQNQGQDQDQTQNNNQNVNITLNQPAPVVLGATSTAQLPSTGTPFEVWELLAGVTPLGFFLRKITNK